MISAIESAFGHVSAYLFSALLVVLYFCGALYHG